jgi:MFS transporter, VNT family, synaptic vesicle glycoprotein 2
MREVEELALIENLETDETTTSSQQPYKTFDYEKALTVIGFGRFHYLLFIICGLANASDAIEILCISFVLPSAECDLDMTSEMKGYLSSVTFLGMLIGGYVWGTFSDIKGRKMTLITGLLFNGLASILAGLTQKYFWLLFFRFLSGIG